MIESYNEKKYLARYELCIKLFQRFELQVSDVVPVRSVYMVSTDKGDKILKKVDCSIEELNFIYEGIQYIKQRFPRVMDFVKTKDNNIYTIWKDETYCMMNVVKGRESDFCNPFDISISAKGLGELHRASEGFKSNLSRKYTCGKLIDNFKRRKQEMEFFKNIANMHECKNGFDKVFLENIDHNIKEIVSSINILENSSYYKICSEEDKVVLCHHDLAHHNILIYNEEAYFVDFDYAVIDLKVHDLCNFINKVVKNFAFDIEKAEIIINDYCSTNSLSKKEFEILYGMLYFPEDFYNISRDYYTRRKEWDEEIFLDRLIRKTGYRKDREEFLIALKNKFLTSKDI